MTQTELKEKRSQTPLAKPELAKTFSAATGAVVLEEAQAAKAERQLHTCSCKLQAELPGGKEWNGRRINKLLKEFKDAGGGPPSPKLLAEFDELLKSLRPDQCRNIEVIEKARNGEKPAHADEILNAFREVLKLRLRASCKISSDACKDKKANKFVPPETRKAIVELFKREGFFDDNPKVLDDLEKALDGQKFSLQQFHAMVEKRASARMAAITATMVRSAGKASEKPSSPTSSNSVQSASQNVASGLRFAIDSVKKPLVQLSNPTFIFTSSESDPVKIAGEAMAKAIETALETVSHEIREEKKRVEQAAFCEEKTDHDREEDLIQSVASEDPELAQYASTIQRDFARNENSPRFSIRAKLESARRSALNSKKSSPPVSSVDEGISGDKPALGRPRIAPIMPFRRVFA